MKMNAIVKGHLLTLLKTGSPDWRGDIQQTLIEHVDEICLAAENFADLRKALENTLNTDDCYRSPCVRHDWHGEARDLLRRIKEEETSNG